MSSVYEGLFYISGVASEYWISAHLACVASLGKIKSRFYFRCLSACDSSSSYAIPLRILETFTNYKFLATTLQWSDDDAKYYMLKLWEKLVDSGKYALAGLFM